MAVPAFFCTSISAMMLTSLLEGQASVEGQKEAYMKVLEQEEKRLRGLGLFEGEKLRIQDTVRVLKEKIKSFDEAKKYPFYRALFAAAMVGSVYLMSGLPGGLMGSALGVITGLTLSSKESGKALSLIESGLEQTAKLARKTVPPLLAGVVTGAIAKFSGLPEEGQVIAAGFGMSAASSFL